LRLVHRQVLDANAVILAADVDYSVDQKKRIAARQQPEDFCDVRRSSSSPLALLVYPLYALSINNRGPGLLPT
jgi:hypothetical protein